MNIFLIISILLGGPAPVPMEDDARVQAVWDLAWAIDSTPDSMAVYDWSRSDEGKVLYVGIVWPDSVTECSLGAYYFKRTRQWSSFGWECP